MAVAITKLLGEAGAASDGSYTTAGTVTPAANKLYLAVVSGDTSPPGSSVTGCGVTWTKITEKTAASSGNYVAVHRSLSTSAGSTDNVTVDFNGQAQVSSTLAVLEVTGMDTSGTNGSGAIVQSATGNTTGTAGSVTLSAFASASNAAFLATIHANTNDTVPESGYTELADILSGSTKTQSEYKASSDTSPSNSWSGSAQQASVGMEIAARNPAGGSTPFTIDTAVEWDYAQDLIVTLSGGDVTDSGSHTSRGVVVRDVGEELGLAYDVPGFEQTRLRDLYCEAVKRVLLQTHWRIAIGDVTLTADQSEYRLDSTIMAIVDGRGSTPAGIGHYALVTLDEMIDRQSANIISPTFRKAVAIEGDLLIVSPTPSDDETLRFYYVPLPDCPTSDTNDFTDSTYGGLPEFARDAVYYYMCWHGARYDQKQPTSNQDVGPMGYKSLFDAEINMLKKFRRNMRARTVVSPRIGYPGTQRPYVSRNDTYPGNC